MVGFDIYSMASTRQMDLERALRRQEQLRLAGVEGGPSVLSRMVAAGRRLAGRERAARPTPAPSAAIYCLTTRPYEPAS